IRSLAFSPDGSLIASGSDDRTIRVWNVKTGELIAGPLRGHRELVTSVAFSPDGRCIASTSKDGIMHLWHAPWQPTFSQKTLPAPTGSDGWITSENGDLLFWVPEVHRVGFHRPCTLWVTDSRQTRLDLTGFYSACGTNWTNCCYTPEISET
ncbi:WD40-repeat-containing domain protein, partial [Vararia minispora EC-137]